jgi:AraC-like DNA-binding protein
MNKEALRLDISDTIKYYLSADQRSTQHFGIDKYGELLESDDFAILSNEGGLKSGAPIKTDHFALILCIQGHSLKTVGPYTFEVVPGSIHIVSPRDFHSFENASDDLLLYMVLFKKEFIASTFIKEHILETLLEQPGEHAPIYHLDKQEFATIRQLFEKIEREYRQANPFYLQMVRLLVVELLYEVNRSHEKAQLLPVKPVGRKSQLVAAFKKLVEEHFLTMHAVNQYAEMLHVSAKHLSEQVKQETGENALTIIHKRLFLEAQYLLGTAQYSVKEVADKLNFDTSSHFSRFFKHFAGVNPSEFNKAIDN